jgi:hypothetical protein
VCREIEYREREIKMGREARRRECEERLKRELARVYV